VKTISSRVLFVSYHFSPSKTIGAKRPTAVAQCLAESAYEVTVLRGSTLDLKEEENSYPNNPALETRMFSIPIRPKRPSRVAAFLRRIRNFIRRDNRKEDNQRSQVQTGSVKKPNKIPLLTSSVNATLEFARAVEGSLEYRKIWMLLAMSRIAPSSLGKKYDIVIASGPPMVSQICGTWASLLCRAPLILDYRDPWFLFDEPEHAETSTAGRNRWIGKIEDAFAIFCARRASALVVASHGTGTHLIETTGIDPTIVHVIPNGFDGLPINEVPQDDGILRMLYCGTLYWKRNPFEVLSSIKRLIDSNSVERDLIRVQLVGQCDFWRGISLTDWVSDQGLDDVVTIRGLVSAEEVRKQIVLSNLLLNFAQGQGRQIPAKSYEYIVSGRPSLVLTELDSDVARLFEASGTGIIVEPGNSNALDAAVLSRYKEVTNHGGQARVEPIGGAELYSRKHTLEKFKMLVDNVISIN